MKKKSVINNLKVMEPKKKQPSRVTLLFIIIFYILIDVLLIKNIILPVYSSYQEKKAEKEYQEILKTATIIVDIKDNLDVSFYSDIKVSDFIENINGTIIDDYKINTQSLGKKKVKFEYINEENIRIPYAYTINIKDDIPPSIWLGSTYSVSLGYTGKLTEDITCADNLDDNPKCEIIGTYDTTVAGEYPLVFKATDSSGNITAKEFTLKVKEPKKNSGSSSSNSSYSRTNISDIIKKHKNENTAIGIDVSSWQGTIDFQKVKDAGVEFVFLRVGTAKGDRDNVLDKRFVEYIKGFNEVNIPVGIYYYSYASNRSIAISDANWVLKQIKDYKVDLPIVYDWESWSIYNEFQQSFYSTSMNAKAFLDTINKAGYQGMLYSSKNYLEKVWFDIGYPVWLAHYTEKTSYQGDYDYWQLCSNGKIPGISGNVDINIYYKTKEK